MKQEYVVTKTLMGSDVDRNRRYISVESTGEDGRLIDGPRKVVVFNWEMNEWTRQMQHELDICLAALREDI